MRKLCLLLLLCALSITGFAQFTITPATSSTCGSPVTLTASPSCNDNVLTLPDDVYSNALPIGFNFKYFGTTYSSFLISSNGYLSFNLGSAGAFSGWSIASGIPTNPDLANSIAGVYTDLLIPSGGTITYGVRGTAPNRKLVVTFCNCALYSCTAQKITFQIMLYEGTDIAEVHIQNRSVCGAWNGGAGIEGVEDPSMSAGTAAPGRNFPPGTWTVGSPDAYRFTPNGSYTAYTVSSISYAPEPGCATSWYRGATLIGTGASISVNPATTTTFQAVRTFCNGSTVTASATVTAATPPTAGTISGAGTVCGNSSQTYTASGTSGGTWTSSNSSVAPINSSSGAVNFANVTTPTTVTFTYTVSNSCGSSSASYTVTVNPDPTFNITGPSPACSGVPFTLGVSFTSPYNTVSTTHSYLWNTGGTTSTISPTQTTSVPITVPYNVTVTNSWGCSTNVSTNITVIPQPVAGSVTCPSNFCAASPGSYTCNVSGNNGAGTWSITGGGADVSINATTGALTINPAQAIVRNITACYTVTNSCGSSTACCSFTIFPNPQFNITGPSAYCSGTPYNLNVSFTSPYSTVATGHSYIWNTSATTPSITDVQTVSTNTNFTYSVTVTNGFGCSTAQSQTVTVWPAARVTMEWCPPPLCVGASGTCMGFPNWTGSYTASWSASPSGIITLSSPTSGTVLVTGVSAGTATVTYTGTNSSSGCSGYATCVITINPTPTAIGGPGNACIGSTTTLTNSVSGGTWSSSNTSVATISGSGSNGIVTGVSTGTATITYAIGSCMTTTVITVNASPTPVIGTCVPMVCENASDVILGDPTYATGYIVTWTCTPPFGTISLSSPSAAGVTVNGIAAGAATVTYTVTDPVTGCSGFDICNVNVQAGPGPIGGPTTVCEGQTIGLAPPPPPGGTWVSSNTAVGTIDAMGNFTGISGGTTTIDYIPGPPGMCPAVTTITVIPMATACVSWAPDVACGCNGWIFSGTPNAIVNYDVFDCGSMLMYSGSIVLDPMGYASIPSMSLGAAECNLCITSITFMGCTWPCSCPAGGCCATRGAPKAGHGTTPIRVTSLEVVPNPNRGSFTLTGTVFTKHDLNVQVVDVLGRTLYNTTIKPQDGHINSTMVMADNIADGVYFIKVTNDDIKEVLRFTLKH